MPCNTVQRVTMTAAPLAAVQQAMSTAGALQIAPHTWRLLNHTVDWVNGTVSVYGDYATDNRVADAIIASVAKAAVKQAIARAGIPAHRVRYNEQFIDIEL